MLFGNAIKRRILAQRHRCEGQSRMAFLHTFYDALIKTKVAAYRCRRLLRHFGVHCCEYILTLGLKG